MIAWNREQERGSPGRIDVRERPHVRPMEAVMVLVPPWCRVHLVASEDEGVGPLQGRLSDTQPLLSEQPSDAVRGGPTISDIRNVVDAHFVPTRQLHTHLGASAGRHDISLVRIRSEHGRRDRTVGRIRELKWIEPRNHGKPLEVTSVHAEHFRRGLGLTILRRGFGLAVLRGSFGLAVFRRGSRVTHPSACRAFSARPA